MTSIAPQTAPRRNIRFWLNCLVLACVVPAVLVTTFIIARSFVRERSDLERDIVGTARALSQAVDAELLGVQSALRVLATSPSLKAGDLKRFYQEAQEVARAIDTSNILVTDATGQQILNTLRPFGADLPRHGNMDQLRRVIDTGQPAISNLFIGAVAKRPIISIEVPVLVGGKVAYALAMGIPPERLSEILRRQKMPSDWAAAIADNDHTLVARTIGGNEIVGRKISPDLKRALQTSTEGTFEGFSREGVEVVSGFSRSAISGWTVAIAIPKESVFGYLWISLAVNVGAAVVLLLAGVLFAKAISDRIAGSIRALREPATDLGSDPTSIPPADIQEVHELGLSLVSARQQIEDRTAERNDLRRRIMSAQEDERLRIAQDLHDQTGQSVTAAILDLKALEPLVNEKDRNRVHLLREQLDQIGQRLHRIAWELRPASIDELGLSNALENYVSEWSDKHSISVDFHCGDAKLDERSNEIRTTIYRIIQEALTNVAKHANATLVSVVIGSSGGVLRLTIEDNGCGFDTSQSSARLGLAGMRERVLLVDGELEIESSRSTGTSIFVRFPLSKRSAA